TPVTAMSAVGSTPCAVAAAAGSDSAGGATLAVGACAPGGAWPASLAGSPPQAASARQAAATARLMPGRRAADGRRGNGFAACMETSLGRHARSSVHVVDALHLTRPI